MIQPADSVAGRAPDREPFITRARVRNYKSIGKCEVDFRPVTVLVGRNGAGKSNFLDALRFVTDALQSSLDHAIKSRGGIDAVRRRSTGHPRNFTIELEMSLPDWKVAKYAFEIAAATRGGFSVRAERLKIIEPNGALGDFFRVNDGEVEAHSEPSFPPAVRDRLYLVNSAGLPKFRAVYDGLVSMGFYNLNPEVMKELQSPDAGELLHRDGRNISSVVARLSADKPQIMDRVKVYLETIVSGISEIERVALGPSETLRFRQKVTGSAHPWQFYAANMSDGTLRAVGNLIAVSQLADRKSPVTLIGIEEPETALHPAAAKALLQALSEAAEHTQVVVTTHSPELLDDTDPDRDALLVVTSENGDTAIAPFDEASREAIRRHLYTAGDLLRMDQLQPDRANLEQQQLALFDADRTGDSV